MTVNHDAESGLELVLDNRKLIVTFAVLIAICGLFFVVGYTLGKRQAGIQSETQSAAGTEREAHVDGPPPDSTGPARANEEPETKPSRQDTGDKPVDWYKNANRHEGEPETITAKPAPEPEIKTPPASRTSAAVPPAAVPIEKPKPQASAEPATYSVQVGAFKQKHELEVRAQQLHQKGFEYRTEASQGEGGYYLLKVGKFRSRAEAVAMQLRLKKNGFACFVKTN